MNWTRAKDISKYQGPFVDTGEPIVIVKIGGGDDGLYFDQNATSNYNAAVRAGKAVGGYWFAGGTDAIAEADYFIRGMSPLVEGDVLALDWEISNPNPVQWCLQFVTEIHNKIGVWPLLYVNLSTLNAYDWSPVLANCGLWLADWAVSPDVDIATHHTYVMQQYSDSPYDLDAWFGTIDEFKAYGYHAPVAQPATVSIPYPEPIQAPIVIQPTPITPAPAKVMDVTPPPKPVVQSQPVVVTPKPAPRPNTTMTTADLEANLPQIVTVLDDVSKITSGVHTTEFYLTAATDFIALLGGLLPNNPLAVRIVAVAGSAVVTVTYVLNRFFLKKQAVKATINLNGG